ncbi:MAG: UDP-N-acetylmuramoyl-L-alanine--D-glutamate ligase [Saprospiraceae bacterium]
MKAVILGAGESGVGAALLAKQKGYNVFVSDYGHIKENYKKELLTNEIPFEENKHTNESIFDADCIIKSPGIADTVNIIQECLKRKIPVLSEIEFAAKFYKGKIIAITGSNGKTTTTKLTYHLLHTAGFSVGIGGNVGISFARLLTQSAPKDYYVLELSSFQLDNCYKFRPAIAMLLNITADHLDRYDYDINKYIAAKFRIIQSQQDTDLFLFNEQDENIKSYLHKKSVGMNTIPVSDKFFDNKTIRTRKHSYTLEGTNLKGPHNAFNATCALLVAEELGAVEALLQKGLNTFVNAPHRLEFVTEINGVEYINDSKATNIDSVYYGLLAMEKPLIWIAGGIDKGNDYNIILPLVKEKVKALICLGADNEKLKAAFAPIINDIKETQSTKEAIALAAELAKPGMTVILSPACSSFDLFENFAKRGELFKEAVHEFKRTIES